MKKVILILGTGHCGSTLLDLVLGSHPEVFSLGELNSLSAKTIRGKEDFWDQELLDRTRKHFRYKRNRLVSYDYHHFPGSKLFENRVSLYKEIFQRVEKQYLVDSSKSLFWVKRSLYHLKNGPFEPILVLLERNPLAVVNSYNRKYNRERGFPEIVENVKQWVIRNQRFFEETRSVKKIQLQYEAICQDPENEVRKLCDLLEITYQSNMLNYWQFRHYNLSGNSGTNSLVNRGKNKNPELDERRRDQAYYSDHPLKIKLDQRWKEELTAQEKEFVVKVFQREQLVLQ